MRTARPLATLLTLAAPLLLAACDPVDASSAPDSSQSCHPTAGDPAGDYVLEFVLTPEAAVRPTDVVVRRWVPEGGAEVELRLAGDDGELVTSGAEAGRVCFVTGAGLAEVRSIAVTTGRPVVVRARTVHGQALAQARLDERTPLAQFGWRVDR
jgi:hypothetical protein